MLYIISGLSEKPYDLFLSISCLGDFGAYVKVEPHQPGSLWDWGAEPASNTLDMLVEQEININWHMPLIV